MDLHKKRKGVHRWVCAFVHIFIFYSCFKQHDFNVEINAV